MPKNSRADETVLHAATSSGTSLRTTVPAFVISQLGLKKGDIFRWEIDKDGKLLFLKIHPQKK
ncbi:MAG: AbrB/MazE/SpoVT family DNA-binding domain-containing protein [Thermoplasmatota archaeon]|jgi:antitoxin component of MazEF toxin-antitoxin module